MALTNAKLHAGINLSKILLNYIFGEGGISFSGELAYTILPCSCAGPDAILSNQPGNIIPPSPHHAEKSKEKKKMWAM